METQELKIFIYAFTSLGLVLGFFIFLVFLIYKKRQNKHLQQIAEMKNELLRSQLEIQEQTLRTISQEIHDNIGQVLSLAKLQLHSLQVQNQWQKALQPTTELISKSIGDLRDLSKSLHPDRIADIGLAESIKQELQYLQKTNTIKTVFLHSGKLQKLSLEKEIIIFRMFQEMMNNVMKHSQAATLKVELIYTEDNLKLTVEDDGKGFDVDTPSGIGFTSLRTRAKLINANLQVNSTHAKGTIVELEVPV